MKIVKNVSVALFIALTIPNVVYAVIWPTCPTPAQISQSRVNEIFYLELNGTILKGTPIVSNSTPWYVHIVMQTKNIGNTALFSKGQQALNAIINNPVEESIKNVFKCTYNTTIDEYTYVLVTSAPLSITNP